MGFSRQEYWSGLPFPSPGVLPNPGTEPGSPALQADSLLSEPPGKPSTSFMRCHILCRVLGYHGVLSKTILTFEYLLGGLTGVVQLSSQWRFMQWCEEDTEPSRKRKEQVEWEKSGAGFLRLVSPGEGSLGPLRAHPTAKSGHRRTVTTWEPTGDSGLRSLLEGWARGHPRPACSQVPSPGRTAGASHTSQSRRFCRQGLEVPGGRSASP